MSDRARAITAVLSAPCDAETLLVERQDPWSRWARAVLLLAQGDYRSAVTDLATLTEDPDVGGMAAAATASALRQIDEHAAALPWDQLACASRRGVVDGSIGLAADLVGLGRTAAAGEQLRYAASLAVTERDRVRVGWVGTEIALARGHVTGAESAAGDALQRALALSAPRHVAKSRLFLGAVLRQVAPERALPLLHEALETAHAMALRPLAWVAVVVLGPEASGPEREIGAAAARFIAAHLPSGHGAAWARRGDIRDLCG